MTFVSMTFARTTVPQISSDTNEQSSNDAAVQPELNRIRRQSYQPYNGDYYNDNNNGYYDYNNNNNNNNRYNQRQRYQQQLQQQQFYANGNNNYNNNGYPNQYYSSDRQDAPPPPPPSPAKQPPAPADGKKYKYTPLFQYKETEQKHKKLFVPNLFG